MENVRVICQTDAEILFDFAQLKHSGFVFSYAKKENGVLQKYVNCNGKNFGPFDSVNFLCCEIDATWIAWKGDLELQFEKNGQICKTVSQKQIEQKLTELAGNNSSAPIEEYDKETHVLRLKRLNQKRQDFFVTDNKRYGPYYWISSPAYRNEDCFQFIYRKRQKSKNWYYNLNGKEIGPFQGKCYGCRCHYDGQNHAILDGLSHYNYILIDGKKIKCFNEKFYYCSISEINGHTIIIGTDSNNQMHFKRDGILQDFAVNTITKLNNGDVVYSKIQDETETWFYNDKQISITVQGECSRIYESLISYWRNSVPYFTIKNKEYNGKETNEIKEGFVFLDNNRICFFPWVAPTFYSIATNTGSFTRSEEGNFIYLYNTNRLAGRD